MNHHTRTRSLYDGGFMSERFTDTYDADCRYERSSCQSKRGDHRTSDQKFICRGTQTYRILHLCARMKKRKS